MFRFITFCYIFSVAIIQCFTQSLSDPDENVQFVCGRSKFIKKCGCFQETDNVMNIPLFNVDCSRLDFSVSPAQKVLPVLVGKLDLSHNLIEQLDEAVQLESLTLYSLDYSHNKIKTISDEYFKNLTNLMSLNLEYNELKNVDQHLVLGLNHLKSLNLAANILTKIPNEFFKNLQELEELNLSKNDLGDFLFEMNIQIFPGSLTILRLDKINLRNITNITFSGLHNIKTFTIIDNPIEDMFILPFEKLEYLDLSGINITKLEAKHLNHTSLKKLNIKRLSKLNTIGDFAFYNCSALETLIIENCDELKEFDPLVFGFLTRNSAKRYKLKRISLAKNDLKSLEGLLEYLFRNLEEVDLQENPWSCECPITWLRNLKNVIDANDTRCNTPPQLEFRIVTELNPKEFICLENRNVYSPSITTTQWLFPLIGILAVIVFILVGILLYMGPFNNYTASWTRSIGPESPYNRMTIENDESTRHL